ncbi:MAG: NAD(P)H-binding protein [Acidobacteria bacterium]|nr:NAD(P)H-binding protein [Acidobacteriota bacterium]
MATKVVVLGGGRVGGAIVRDLVRSGGWDVRVADASEQALAQLAVKTGAGTIQADLSRAEEVQRAIRDADLVIGAVPGFMGYQTVKAVIAAGKNMVDISFFPEDPFGLDAAAQERGVTVVVDCGVAPGCGNIVLGYTNTRLDEIERFTCMVGGLPVERRWPYEYRAVFSPIDVIEEYTRPARLVEHGRVVIRPALSEVELVDLPGIGTLEAFNTDGLRSLLTTMSHIPFMKEKTLRYPGHAERMRMLRETGFFSQVPVEVDHTRVTPLSLTAKLLFEAWRLPRGEEDLTVMRIEIVGRRDGQRARVVYDLLDRYDRDTGTTSMARTTGYTCTAVARAVADGLFREPGISAPEDLGKMPGVYELVMKHLADRGIVFKISETPGDEGDRGENA